MCLAEDGDEHVIEGEATGRIPGEGQQLLLLDDLGTIRARRQTATSFPFRSLEKRAVDVEVGGLL